MINMAYQLEVKLEARQDIIDGFLWYEEKNSGLGSRFVSEVEEMIQYISEYPQHFQVKYSVYREAILKVFPFVISYEFLDESVVVYSVFPTKSDPEKKVK